MEARTQKNSGSLTLIANYPSDVGYAWWLMESFWSRLSNITSLQSVHLLYPTINDVPEEIDTSDINLNEAYFGEVKVFNLVKQMKLIRRFRTKVLYLTDYQSFSVNYFIFRLLGVRLIINHDHTPGEMNASNKLKLITKKILWMLKVFTPDAVFATSEYVMKRNISVQGAPKDKVFSIDNGIKLSSASEEISNSQQNNMITLIASGRVHPYKGVFELINTIHILDSLSKSVPWKLLYLGDGPAINDLKSLVNSYNLNHRIEFLGQVKNPSPYYAKADIGLHFSHGEVGYSLSILEMMYNQLLVVASNNDSVSSIIEEGVNGFKVNINDCEETAKKLLELITNYPGSSNIRMHAKEFVQSHFDHNSTLKKLTIAYKSLEKTYV